MIGMNIEQQKNLASEKMRSFFEKKGIVRKGRAIKFPMKVGNILYRKETNFPNFVLMLTMFLVYK